MFRQQSQLFYWQVLKHNVVKKVSPCCFRPDKGTSGPDLFCSPPIFHCCKTFLGSMVSTVVTNSLSCGHGPPSNPDSCLFAYHVNFSSSSRHILISSEAAARDVDQQGKAKTHGSQNTTNLVPLHSFAAKPAQLRSS